MKSAWPHRPHNFRPVFCSIVFFFASIYSEEVCEAYFTQHPSNFDGQTIVLPPEAVALSPNFFVGGISSTTDSLLAQGEPPSIFVVIDHSGSMTGEGSNSSNDRYGSRYTVTRDLLDTIYAVYPNAEVGVAVFTSVLFFDHTNNSIFTPLAGYGDQSYLPLLQLNQTVSDGTGRTGLQAIKDILETETVQGSNGEYVDLVYKPDFNADQFTNINIGFEAAKAAMAQSHHPKENQFILFLSDGDANRPEGEEHLFVEGNNVPTTFTVFFTPEDQPPEALAEMTDNILNNGYSTSNVFTNIWTIETNHDTLMSFLVEYVFHTITQTIATQTIPTQIRVNNIRSTQYSDSVFLFNSRFPFNLDITHFDVEITYIMRADVGGSRFETEEISFDVRVEEGATLPAGWHLDCWDRDLSFYYNGRLLTEVIDTMRELEIRFTTDNAQEYPSVSTTIRNTNTPVRDLETFALSSGGGYMSSAFPSRIAATGTQGDGIVQHKSADSLTAIFRNPSLPLDTLRVAIPVVPATRLGVTSIVSLDTSGNGYLDAIELYFDGVMDLPPEITTDSIDISFLHESGIASFDAADITTYVQNGQTVLHITINENTTAAAGDLQTGWTPEISIGGMEYYTQPIQEQETDDGAGPVIETVLLALGDIQGGDTLTVTFSEPVDVNQLINSSSVNQAFYFYDNGQLNPDILNGARYVPVSTSQYSTEIKIVVQNTEIIPYEDLIQLVSGTTDESGNIPPGADIARTVPISLASGNNIAIAVSNNPFTPGKTTIDEKVRTTYATALPSNTIGTLIAVNTVKPLADMGDGSYGRAMIFDAVGNLVRKDLKLYRASHYRYYGLIWDGRNRNGRYVGGGTYLVLLEGKDTEGQSFSQTVKVGVKWQ